MRTKKLLPILLMALLLVWLFLPDTGSTAPPAATPKPSAELALVTAAPTPKASPTPGAPTPTPELPPTLPPHTEKPQSAETTLDEDGSYTSKEDVALYIHLYGHLPSNYITKKEAEAAGWKGGALERVLPGMSIGGDYFGNYEGLLPKAKGRKWTECDVNPTGTRNRSDDRIVFSNDGLIYFTGDHYETFELLYD